MKIVFHVPELARTQACLNNLHNYLNSGEVTLSDELLVIFNGDALKLYINQKLVLKTGYN